MSDYTPITTEDIYSCFDYGYRNRSKVSFSVTKIAFDSWLAVHDAEVREQAARRALDAWQASDDADYCGRGHHVGIDTVQQAILMDVDWIAGREEDTK